MIKRLVSPIEIDEEGNPVIRTDCSESNVDPIRAARLARSARNGSRKAQGKLKKMDEQRTVEVIDSEGES